MDTVLDTRVVTRMVAVSIRRIHTPRDPRVYNHLVFWMPLAPISATTDMVLFVVMCFSACAE
jgi:hypothetical protein